MKERPILFKGEMVKAILEGRKTQTRRIVKPQPEAPRCIYHCDGSDTVETVNLGTAMRPGGSPCTAASFHWKMTRLNTVKSEHVDSTGFKWLCPYGQPGDRLWVRETWGVVNSLDSVKPSELPQDIPIICRASSVHPNEPSMLWRPSIFMPRKASRITLEIVNIRVERLQDISEEDARAEGVEQIPESKGSEYINYLDESSFEWSAIRSFETLWEKINGVCSWDENPWVWVVEFKRVT